MTRLIRQYRPFLHAYPAHYRRERGDELLDTLLSAAEPGQRWARPREIVSLIVAGLRIHLQGNEPKSARQTWATGLRVGTLLLLARAFSDTTADLAAVPREFSTRATVAVLLTAVVAFAALLRGWPAMAATATLAWQAAQLRSQSLSWYLLTAAVLLIAQAIWLRHARGTVSSGWLLAVAAWQAPLFLPSPYQYIQLAAFAMVLLCAAVTPLNPAAPIAGACFMVGEALRDTLRLPLGDIPLTAAPLLVVPSWWTVACVVAAAGLAVRGYTGARVHGRI